MPKRKVWHRAIRLQDLSCLRSLQWSPLSASVPFSLSCLAPSPFLLSPHASRTAMAPAKQLTIMFKTKRETEKNHERRSLEQRSFNYASCFHMPIGFLLSLGVGVGGKAGKAMLFFFILLHLLKYLQIWIKLTSPK